MNAKQERHLFREAKLKHKEAKKLLRRGRRKLARPVKEQVRQVLDRLDEARRAGEVQPLRAAIAELEPLASNHLAQFRKSALREYSESIGLAVLLALMLRAFVVEAFQIPSESMIPTLLVGDHLFVNKFIYGVRLPFTRIDLIRFSDPQPGDVVVFIFPVEEVRTQAQLREIMSHLIAYRNRSPDRAYPEDLDAIGLGAATDAWGNPFIYERLSPSEYRLLSLGKDGIESTGDDLSNLNTAIRPGQRPCLTQENLEEAKDYIKRVIGLPGDRIRVHDNVVFVNDRPIDQNLLPIDESAPENRYGQPLRRAVEWHGDTQYIIQYFGTIPDFDEITVREGHLFVMGDNRDNSSDSRCWGQVPIENVKGQALFIFWSGGDSDGFLGNRWSRMFDVVD